jgi:hypothetical protein
VRTQTSELGYAKGTAATDAADEPGLGSVGSRAGNGPLQIKPAEKNSIFPNKLRERNRKLEREIAMVAGLDDDNEQALSIEVVDKIDRTWLCN